MPEIALDRLDGERRAYELADVGTLRLGRWGSTATAEAGGREWRLERSGLLRQRVMATDAMTGATVATLLLRGLLRGGTLELEGRALEWSRERGWRTRWRLAAGDRELALFHGSGWGRLPVHVTLPDGAEPPPLALLLGCWLTIVLAQEVAAGSS